MALNTQVVVNQKFERLRERIEKIPDSIALSGEVIYKGRNTIYRTVIDGIDLTVKEFHVPALPNRFAYTFLRSGKAERSYRNALQLAELGIGTAEPIAYIVEYRNGLLLRSFYVCRMVDGQNIRHWETLVPDCGAMVRALAGFMLELHEKGVFHKDFSPGNILFHKDGKGEYRFFLVDINRMRFGVRDKRVLFRNFRCLNIESEAETARVAREYAVAAHLDPREMENMALRLLRDYHREKARHRRFKRLFRSFRLF